MLRGQRLIFTFLFNSWFGVAISYVRPGIQPRGNIASGGIGGYLPPGYTLLDGEIVDMSNKLIQRIGDGRGSGTQYFAWTDQRGPPIFRRREMDVGKRFVIFPDRNYMPGDGHYVVLRKFRRGNIPMRRAAGGLIGSLYEAYYLDLGDSINAMVTNYDSLSPGIAGNFRSLMTRRGGMNYRMKRKIIDTNVEIMPLQKLRLVGQDRIDRVNGPVRANMATTDRIVERMSQEVEQSPPDNNNELVDSQWRNVTLELPSSSNDRNLTSPQNAPKTPQNVQ